MSQQRNPKGRYTAAIANAVDINLRLSASVKKSLKEYAEKEGVTMSEVVQGLIEKYLIAL